MARDTIFALSSGQGTSAIALIRLSGSLSHQIIRDLTGSALPEPRHLVRRDIVGDAGDIIDHGMIVVFPEGQSYTGEPMAEIHCHGGRAIVREVSQRLGSLEGCRCAEPGEFTLRAFQSGRLDLTEVEGLGDLIAAQTERQRQEAMRLVQGEASQKTEAWRNDLVHALALLEVTIDWADEEVPEDVMPSVEALLDGLLTELSTELDLIQTGYKLRDGFEVAIVGPPNVGKSTLLNALAGREAAITSEIPGTTRDVIEVPYDLNGLLIRFLDTAGLRQTDDPIESEGVDRAVARARDADLRVFLRSFDTTADDIENELRKSDDLIVHTKTDLSEALSGIGISAKTGRGLQEVVEAISSVLDKRHQRFSLFSSDRRSTSIQKAFVELSACRSKLSSTDIEVVAEDLRLILRHLDVVIGHVGVEDVLGDVFSRFCLGK